MKIDSIKTRISLRDILQHYNLHPNYHNFICCPFHDEKTPSLKIYDNGNFSCFGCGKHGDLIDFVAFCENTNTKTAISLIDDWYNLGLSAPLTAEQKQLLKKQQAERERAIQRKKNLDLYTKSITTRILTAIYDTERVIYYYDNLYHSQKTPLTIDCTPLYDALKRLEKLDYIYELVALNSVRDGQYKYIFGTDKVKFLRMLYSKKICIDF